MSYYHHDRTATYDTALPKGLVRTLKDLVDSLREGVTLDPADRQRVKWAAARLGIQAYIVFAFFSVVGGLLTYPLATRILIGDWRCWKYWRLAPRLYFFMWRGIWYILTKNAPVFVFSVPLTAPPQTAPDPSKVRIRADWPHGTGCGDCVSCCKIIGCPIMDPKGGGCLGYDGPLWRYLNCGRYPTSQRYLDFYGCKKWELLKH